MDFCFATQIRSRVLVQELKSCGAVIRLADGVLLLSQILELTAINNLDWLDWFATRCSSSFNLADNVHAFNNTAKNDVLAIQPRSLGSAEEELASVGVGASIGHGEDTWTGVLQGEVFILKLVAIDGLSTSAIVVREVTTLAHELGDDTVERGSLEAKTTLAGAESAEIFSSARHYVGTQLHDDSSAVDIVDGNIKKAFRVGHFFRLSYFGGVETSRCYSGTR